MDEFDDKLRRLLGEHAKIKLQLELKRKELRIRNLKEKQDREKREQEHLDEKRKKAEEIFAITRGFLQRDLYFDLLDLFKDTDSIRNWRPSRYAYRSRFDFVRSWSSSSDDALVVWWKEGRGGSTKRLALASDGSLSYEIGGDDAPWRRRGRNTRRRRFNNPADMAWGLSLARINEIHASLSMQGIVDLITWQITDEIHEKEGQLVKDDVQPESDESDYGEEDLGEPEEALFDDDDE
nr:hypothetical protein [Candidatus Sigynarchaeota archaeon]